MELLILTSGASFRVDCAVPMCNRHATAQHFGNRVPVIFWNRQAGSQLSKSSDSSVSIVRTLATVASNISSARERLERFFTDSHLYDHRAARWKRYRQWEVYSKSIRREKNLDAKSPERCRMQRPIESSLYRTGLNDYGTLWIQECRIIHQNLRTIIRGTRLACSKGQD